MFGFHACSILGQLLGSQIAHGLCRKNMYSTGKILRQWQDFVFYAQNDWLNWFHDIIASKKTYCDTYCQTKILLYRYFNNIAQPYYLASKSRRQTYITALMMIPLQFLSLDDTPLELAPLQHHGNQQSGLLQCTAGCS